MRNAARKIETEESKALVCAYAMLEIDRHELARAGRILDQIRDLDSPHKELELVRLVMAHNSAYQEMERVRPALNSN